MEELIAILISALVVYVIGLPIAQAIHQEREEEYSHDSRE